MAGDGFSASGKRHEMKSVTPTYLKILDESYFSEISENGRGEEELKLHAKITSIGLRKLAKKPNERCRVLCKGDDANTHLQTEIRNFPVLFTELVVHYSLSKKK